MPFATEKRTPGNEWRRAAATPLKGGVRSLMQARRRLIQKRISQRRVTYAEVIEEAALEKDVSQRTVEDALREQGIRYRPARKKIYLSDKDAKARVNLLRRWVKKPKKFFDTHHWLSDARNVVVLRLTEPVFE